MISRKDSKIDEIVKILCSYLETQAPTNKNGRAVHKPYRIVQSIVGVDNVSKQICKGGS